METEAVKIVAICNFQVGIKPKSVIRKSRFLFVSKQVENNVLR